MAKGETVQIEVSILQELQGRLAALELAEKQRQELAANPPDLTLDKQYEAWKAEVSRPASVRTQEIADRLFKGPQRYSVRLDTATKKRPDGVAPEHFPLVIAANSDLEARARYESVMGITKHDYTIRVDPVAA